MGRCGTVPRSLHLGMGWFPDQPGGLNRYVRELWALFETAGVETAAVVVGPASDAPPAVTVARAQGRRCSTRLLEYARAARHGRPTRRSSTSISGSTRPFPCG